MAAKTNVFHFFDLSVDLQISILCFLPLPHFIRVTYWNKKFYDLVHANLLNYALETGVIYYSQALASHFVEFEINKKGQWEAKKLKSLSFQVESQDENSNQELLHSVGLCLLKECMQLYKVRQLSSIKYYKSFPLLTELILRGNFKAAKMFLKFVFLKYPALREKQIDAKTILFYLDKVHELLDKNSKVVDFHLATNTEMWLIQKAYHFYYHYIAELVKSKVIKWNTNNPAPPVPPHAPAAAVAAAAAVPPTTISNLSSTNSYSQKYNKEEMYLLLQNLEPESKDYKWLHSHIQFFELESLSRPSKQKMELMESIFDEYPIKALGNTMGWEMYSPSSNEISKNPQKAFKYCSISAKRGHVLSMNNLGVLYKTGTGVEANPEKAVEMYALAAENGDSYGNVNLAHCLDKGTGIQQNHQLALKHFKYAAKYSHDDAQMKVGYYYQMGIGVPVNYKLAVQFYQKSILRDNSAAFNNLGMLYESGLGVPRNLHLAIAMYKTACDKDSPVAFNNLGLCYLYGKGLKKPDYEEAERCLKLAIQKGHTNAKNYLEGLYQMQGKITQVPPFPLSLFSMPKYLLQWTNVLFTGLSL